MEEVRFQTKEYEGSKWGHYNPLDEPEEAYLEFLGGGDALVQCGRYSFRPESSMENAARLCLRTLSQKLQRPVYDYNHDLSKFYTTKKQSVRGGLQRFR
ncbi:hypothetical protein PIB30_081637 [Stylosanthes scabra]|uniref:Uncharacterized protein n=1 Tax=Stylosanthes scabra TaxID=79078 RepID=A0ABU6RRM1_9FABA|nr:hypothetical protein [Stylosanthes scabra]